MRFAYSAGLSLLVLSLAACATPTSEPQPEAPEPQPSLSEAPTPQAKDGSSERSDLLEFARAQVRESGLEGEVEFSDPWVRQSEAWAFVRAAFRRPDGREIFETDPDYCDSDAVVELLLRRNGSEWEIVSGDREGNPYCVSTSSATTAT